MSVQSYRELEDGGPAPAERQRERDEEDEDEDDIASIASAAPSLPPVLVDSTPFPLVPAISRRTRFVLINLLQDSRAVRSYALFVLSFGVFATMFLTNNAGLGLNDTCKQYTAIDLVDNPFCSPPPAASTNQTVSYPLYLDHSNDHIMLVASVFLVWAGNSVYHAHLWLALVPALGLQAAALTFYVQDIPFCQWSELVQPTKRCLTPDGRAPPSALSACQAEAISYCESNTTADALTYVSFYNLCFFVAIVLLTAVCAWTLGTAALNAFAHRCCSPHRDDVDLPLAPAPLQAPRDSLVLLWTWCDLHVFRRLFHTDTYSLWQEELDGDDSAAAIVRSIPISQSLRVSFALTFSVVASTVFTVTLGLMLAMRRDRATVCVVLGAAAAYLLVFVMMAVHVCALRLHIRHRVYTFVRAEQEGRLHETLVKTKLRWFTVSFYAGSLFGSMLWTYVLTTCTVALTAFGLSEESVRGWLEDNWWAIARGVVWPLCFLFVYRSIAAFLVFSRCLFNKQTSVLLRVRRPRLYLALDVLATWIGGWASFLTIFLRIALVIPTAIGRVDVATGGLYDLAHEQFKSLVVVEAWRVWRDHKRLERGVNVWQKDGAWELDEIDAQMSHAQGTDWNF